MVVFTVCSNNLLSFLTKLKLVASLKFVSTRCDNYLLTSNCTEAHVTCDKIA